MSMNTPRLSKLSTPAMALAIALIGTGCGSDSTPASTQDGSASTSGTGTVSNVPNDAGTHATTHSTDHTGTATMDANDIRINGAEPGTPVYNERYAASKDIRGYRSQLMAELEAIRTRLNDGTRAADAAKKDQDRAADLAQGLERMDRLIKAVEESDDLAWTSIRESRLKEAGEVRVWATEHGFKGGA